MSHYFTNDNYDNEETYMHKTYIDGQQFMFKTTKGVFSRDGLDYGTRLLLETLINIPIKGTVLDIGCGYGPIGIVLGRFKDVFIHMVDVNRKALELAKENASINNVKQVKIYESDSYTKITDKFDYIISNPPIRAGKTVVYDIVGGAINYLKEDGQLLIVIRKAQGAKSLIKDMANIYNIEVPLKQKGYYVLKLVPLS